MSAETNACGLRPLETLSASEKQTMLFQLSRLVARTIDELAQSGRVDLIAPLHDISKLLRTLSHDIAGSDAFRDVVVAVAQLLRTVRNLSPIRTASGTVH